MEINQDFTRINAMGRAQSFVFVTHLYLVFASRHGIELVSDRESNSSVVSPHKISREMVGRLPHVIITRVTIPPHSKQPSSIVGFAKADDLVKDIRRLLCLVGSRI
jgi:hypothetical protein